MEYATPPNFADDAAPPDARPSLARVRLELLGLSPDDMPDRIMDLETDLESVREVLSVTLEQLAADRRHIRHLTGRIAGLLVELRLLASRRT